MWTHQILWSFLAILSASLIGRLVVRYRQEGITIPFPTRRILSEAVE